MPNDFEEAWEQTPKQLAWDISTNRGGTGGDKLVLVRRAILDAKVVESNSRVATWTKWLAIATFVLALATVALAVVAATD